MYFKYGNHQHPNNEVGLEGLRRESVQENGIIYGYRETWQLFGRVTASTPSGVTTELATLEAAYGKQNQTAAFHEDDGTITQHELSSSSAIGGVQVLEPVNYEISEGSQYSTYRDWTVTLGATVLDSSILTILWEETLTFRGGGPKRSFLEPITGAPLMQIVKQRTTYKATQVGRSIGLRRYVGAARPRWPLDMHQDQSEVATVHPSERFGQPGRAQFAKYETQWRYSFESISPLRAFPTAWPAF